MSIFRFGYTWTTWGILPGKYDNKDRIFLEECGKKWNFEKTKKSKEKNLNILKKPIDMESWILYLNKKIGIGKDPAKEILAYSVAKNLKIDQETERVIDADSNRTFNESGIFGNNDKIK